MEISLAILKGCKIHKDVKVDSNPYVIGRCRTANFIIAHVNVSRNHCHIVHENFLWKVNDYSSSGTYVNDELVGKKQSRVLNSGDLIRFGPIESNLCWTFYPLNEFVNDLEQCEGLLETNAIKDHKENKETNGNIFHMETNCKGVKTIKVHQELLKEEELRMSNTSDDFSPSLEHNENNSKSNGKNCEKIITQPKKCEDEIVDCIFYEKKYIAQTEIFQNKYGDVDFQQNSDLTKGKVKSKAKICEKQSNISEKRSSLQKEDLQNKSFELQKIENNEIKTFSGMLKVMERSITLPQKSIETHAIKEPYFTENLLGKDQQENIHDQKYLYFNKKARIETDTDVKHEMEQSRQGKTEELMKELEQLKSVLSDLEYKNSALEGELAAASNCKNEALQLKSNLLENLADLMEDELQCTICSELFVQAITLSCTHTFCKFCINQWRKKQKTCPICRKKITNETRSLVVDNYIDKMVGNLSLELKERREAIIAERNESLHQKKVTLRKSKVSNFR